ncbi:MAG: cysteine--tRNA ligase [Gammaproteobacteria bacterium]|nr:cysteine--tRNA ligase [Gammaproteobacteria bacterium]MYF38541.1 cysteine--tRNA ligase [Gammaproteobacteria bacterium]
MDLYLYDTKSRKKRLFVPIDPAHVTIYVCGPTVYDRVHIGNGLSAVVFDVLVRLLRALYPRVTYVRNITDIEDKIIAAAQANNEPWQELTERFTATFHDDMRALYVLEPDVEPKPTQLVDEIVQMIDTLITRGFAYEADGHVLFAVSADPNYGTLSRRTIEEMLDGARVEVAPYKRDPKDFVLWKPSSSDQPGWESPWGIGRPGWHIECSTMIRIHLGSNIDIHGAGTDLIFPHNENELAQGTAVEDGAKYVNYWLHNGMLNMGGQKMAKSVGNIVSIADLRERFPGEVIRYALLTGHYRQSLLWSDQLLQQASQSVASLYRALRHARDISGEEELTAKSFQSAPLTQFPEEVLNPLVNDLHTPKALAGLHSLAKKIQSTSASEDIIRLRDQFLAGAWLLGLFNVPVKDYFQREDEEIESSTIEDLIQSRNEARRNKDFTRADEIRDFLASKGIELEDTRNGTRWSRR